VATPVQAAVLPAVIVVAIASAIGTARFTQSARQQRADGAGKTRRVVSAPALVTASQLAVVALCVIDLNLNEINKGRPVMLASLFTYDKATGYLYSLSFV
jgi:hypothetical protein